MSHLEDGSWSAPSAISCLGVGYGAQAGLEFTDLVIVLRDENALNALSQVGNLTIGGSVSATLGPWGRSAEISMAATCALCYAFSKTRGLFGGISIEGLAFCEGRKANTKCYGQGVTARHILNGQIQKLKQMHLKYFLMKKRGRGMKQHNMIRLFMHIIMMLQKIILIV